jgi:hypothetical protein
METKDPVYFDNSVDHKLTLSLTMNASPENLTNMVNAAFKDDEMDKSDRVRAC